MTPETSAEPLPPRQLATSLFPVIGERGPEPFDPLTWRLTVDGVAARPLSLTWSEFVALPHESRTGTLHCVTRWSRPRSTFRGVPLSVLLDMAGPLPEARFVRCVSGRGHDTSLPLDAAAEDVLVADEFNAGTGRFEALPPPHGGPLRTVLFSRYLYKSVKWLRRVELCAQDQLGMWERTAGYHNGADPWREERYVVRGVDHAELRRLLAARSLSGHDLLGADLRGADLSGFDLRAAHLRNATLADACLRGADLRDARLCNADLTRADLSAARLDRIDLDGADLREADLRSSRGAPGSLAATEFCAPDGSLGSRVSGLDWRATPLDGALPEQVAYLRGEGVHLAE